MSKTKKNQYRSSEKEVELRFFVVMLMDYFIEKEYLQELFRIFDEIKHEGYYVKMAVAWAISVCYVKFPEETSLYLKHNELDDFTYHKALSKITESNRVSTPEKEKIRSMKRK